MKLIPPMTIKLCALSLILGLALPQALGWAEEKAALVDIGNMAIPESLGKIDERFQGTSKHWVIDIQDVHAHFGAQENIAAIIDHLNEVYGLRLVAYEGGWNITSFSKTWEIPSSRQKQLVLRTLMEEDLITGPAFAAMNSKTPITLHGVENAELYKQNLRIYLQFIDNKASVEKEIATFQESLASKKRDLYNPELLDFDRALSQFREDAKASEKFLPYLLAQAKTLSIDLNSLPQMQLFMQVRNIEKAIDKIKLKSEIDRLMQEHKNSQLSFEEMLRHGTLTDEKLSFYPNAQKQRDLLKLTDQIVHDQLFAEIDKSVLLVKEKLFKNSAEKELDQEFDRYMTAKKIMLFKATPTEIRLYRAARTLIRKEMKAAQLNKHLKLGNAFYSLAEKRNEVFFEKITSTPELSSEDIALVAGGFHTDGVRELLRNSGVSYIVITPQLGQEGPNETLYLKGLQELKALTQTLSSLGNAWSDELDRVIAYAIQQYLSNQGRFPNLSELVAFVKSSAHPAAKVTTQSFLSLSEEEQRLVADRAAENILHGHEKLVEVVKAETLAALLAGKDAARARSALDVITRNRDTLLVVLYENSIADVLELVDTLRKTVKTFRGSRFEPALAQNNLKDAVREHRIAVVSDHFTRKGILTLREDVSSILLFRVLLAKWEYNWEEPEAVMAFVKLVEEALAAKGFSASA